MALTFLLVSGRRVTGTMLVAESVSGRDISQVSVVPSEQEVRFSFSTRFEVIDRPLTDGAKHHRVPDFQKFNVTDLDIYVLRERYIVHKEVWADEMEWYKMYAEWSFRELHPCGVAGGLVTCSYCEVRSLDDHVIHFEVFERQTLKDGWWSKPTGNSM